MANKIHEAGARAIPGPGRTIILDGASYTVTPSDMVLSSNDNPDGGLVYLDQPLHKYEFEIVPRAGE